jgi:predicted HTH transcriptional regulator
MSDDEKRELKYAKGELEFEKERPTEFNQELLDQEVIAEFVERIKAKEGLTMSVAIDELLLSNGLITKKSDKLYLNYAGILLFAKDPVQFLPGAKIHFLKYTGKEEKFGAEHNVVKEAIFDGPLPKIILKVRDFVKSQLREFQHLDDVGKFVEESEYPELAWLEAIVNALVHRSYSIKNSKIFIKLFDDKMVIESPGKFPGVVTAHNLIHYPRNPVLMTAMKYFGHVKMVREGTKRMFYEMAKMQLPPPEFKEEPRENPTHVVVTLFNHIDERTKKWDKTKSATITQTGNLFNLILKNSVPEGYDRPDFSWLLKQEFVKKIISKGYLVKKFVQAAYNPSKPIFVVEANGKKLCGAYHSFRFSFQRIGNNIYLVIDPRVEFKNHLKLSEIFEILPELRKMPSRFSKGHLVQDKNETGEIRIVEIADGAAKIAVDETISHVELDKIIPSLKISTAQQILARQNISFDLDKEIKKYSYLLQPNSARLRFAKTKEIAQELSENVFPIKFGSSEISLNIEPDKLILPNFYFNSDLIEPPVTFDKGFTQRDTIILSGLVKFGAFDKPQKDLHVIPLCTPNELQSMIALIRLLKAGSYKYQGMERTFGLRLIEETAHVVASPEAYVSECEKIVPTLDKSKEYLFLVYCSETDYPLDNYNSPYYKVKKFLLEKGHLSQMIDKGTLNNPTYKDLNIALDIFAKNGNVPWVLSEGLADADLFVGLTYSSIRTKSGINRIIGYVNIFDKFGRWQFCKGNLEAFPFEERKSYFSRLIATSIEQLRKERNIKKVYIHHSYKLDKEIKEEIYNRLSAIIPGITVYFVWINQHHAIRLYDVSPIGDGSIGRGKYVITARNRLYVATTGDNPLSQKGMGTPKVLEVTVSPYPKERYIDLKLAAQHILSLTKLNWASTKSFCHEPITLKFSRNIAYLMNAFLRTSDSFKLHSSLENKPWFI